MFRLYKKIEVVPPGFINIWLSNEYLNLYVWNVHALDPQTMEEYEICQICAANGVKIV